jgi:phosphate acetyltransferase
MERVHRVAQLKPQRLLLAEAEDERIVRAAERLAREHIAEVGVVGAREALKETARRAGVGLAGVEVIEAAEPGEVARTAAELVAARGERLAEAKRDRYARDPLFQAVCRVRLGLADTFVCGASRATADVLRASLYLLGLAAGTKTLSSFFLMVLSGGGGRERALVFADCAVVPDPSPEQLADIGILAAEHYRLLTQDIPHAAFLSFSTRGSAEHARVAKVRKAVSLARERRPDLHLDGEMQLDAAIVPDVGRRKAPDSVVAGHANVLVFPDLDAGNIGYKLVQRLAGARAYGPILMGLARQGNDLSRGCSVEDVVETATIACALAASSPRGRGREQARQGSASAAGPPMGSS